MFTCACSYDIITEEGETIHLNSLLSNISSYEEAAKILTSYYGNASINNMELSLCDGPFIDVSDETLDLFLKGNL